MYIAPLSSLLVPIVQRLLQSDDPRSDFWESFANSACVISSCMQALAKRIPEEWEGEVDLVEWSRTCIEKWGWSDNVISGLVELLRARYFFLGVVFGLGVDIF
jgi:U3 small nucleolar RNA-associated protein 20